MQPSRGRSATAPLSVVPGRPAVEVQDCTGNLRIEGGRRHQECNSSNPAAGTSNTVPIQGFPLRRAQHPQAAGQAVGGPSGELKWQRKSMELKLLTKVLQALSDTMLAGFAALLTEHPESACRHCGRGRWPKA